MRRVYVDTGPLSQRNATLRVEASVHVGELHDHVPDAMQAHVHRRQTPRHTVFPWTRTLFVVQQAVEKQPVLEEQLRRPLVNDAPSKTAMDVGEVHLRLHVGVHHVVVFEGAEVGGASHALLALTGAAAWHAWQCLMKFPDSGASAFIGLSSLPAQTHPNFTTESQRSPKLSTVFNGSLLKPLKPLKPLKLSKTVRGR